LNPLSTGSIRFLNGGGGAFDNGQFRREHLRIIRLERAGDGVAGDGTGSSEPWLSRGTQRLGVTVANRFPRLAARWAPVRVLLDYHNLPQLLRRPMRQAIREAQILWLEIRPEELEIYRSVSRGEMSPAEALQRKGSSRLVDISFESRRRQDLELLHGKDVRLEGEPEWSEEILSLRDEMAGKETMAHAMILMLGTLDEWILSFLDAANRFDVEARVLRDEVILDQWRGLIRDNPRQRLRIVIGDYHHGIAEQLLAEQGFGQQQRAWLVRTVEGPQLPSEILPSIVLGRVPEPDAHAKSFEMAHSCHRLENENQFHPPRPGRRRKKGG